MPAETNEEEPKSDLIALLRVIQSEYSQLSELTEVELQDIRKLVAGLKVLQSAVEQAIPIRRDALGDAFDGIASAHLVSDCVVLVTLENGTMVSRPLTSLQTKTVLAVIQEAVPELNRLISEQRKDIHARINLLERALKELKKTEAALKRSEDVVAPSQEDDLMRRSITTG